MKVLGFVHLKNILLFLLMKSNSFWKKITEEESEEADEFHVCKNYLGQSSSKNISKIFLMGFLCFSNLRARFSGFFSAFFFPVIFYSFLSAVITKEIGVPYRHNYFTNEKDRG